MDKNFILFIVGIIIGCICLLIFAYHFDENRLKKDFESMTKEYSQFSVQNNVFNTKDIKNIEAKTEIYSEDSYKIEMENGTLILVGEYDIIWYK